MIGKAESGSSGCSRLQPFPDVFSESHQVIYFLQIGINLIPVNAQVLVDENISEARKGSKFPGKLSRKHSQFTHSQECIVVVCRLHRFLYRNDPMTDIEAALGGHFQVALHDIPQIRISIELSAGFALQRLQARQAFVQFVQAPLDTAELGIHAGLPVKGRPSALSAPANSHNTDS